MCFWGSVAKGILFLVSTFVIVTILCVDTGLEKKEKEHCSDLIKVRYT